MPSKRPAMMVILSARINPHLPCITASNVHIRGYLSAFILLHGCAPTGLARFRELRGLASGDTTEYDRFDRRIAAQPVGSMDTTGHLAGCIKTNNRLAAFRERLRLPVDGNSAHRVVDARLDFDGTVVR